MRARVGHCADCNAPFRTDEDGRGVTVKGVQLVAVDLGGPDAMVVPHWNWCRAAIPVDLLAESTTAEQIAQPDD